MKRRTDRPRLAPRYVAATMVLLFAGPIAPAAAEGTTEVSGAEPASATAVSEPGEPEHAVSDPADLQSADPEPKVSEPVEPDVPVVPQPSASPEGPETPAATAPVNPDPAMPDPAMPDPAMPAPSETPTTTALPATSAPTEAAAETVHTSDPAEKSENPAAAALTEMPAPAAGPVRRAMRPTGPEVTLSATSYDFGEVIAGARAYSGAALVVLNTGPAPVLLSGETFSGSGADAFGTGSPCTGRTLQPDQGCTLDLRFQPEHPGAFAATLTLETDVAGSHQIDLRGTGVAVPLSVTPRSLDFGEVPVGGQKTLDVEVTNTGTDALDVAVDPYNSVFSAPSPHECRDLAPGGTCTIPVTFQPNQVGSADLATQVSIVSMNSRPGIDVEFGGTGIDSVISTDTERVDFGQVRVDGQTLPERIVTISRDVGEAVTLDVDVTGPFEVDRCGGAAPIGTDFCVVIRLKGVGPVEGELQVVAHTSAGVTEEMFVRLRGWGTVEAPVLSIEPETIDFGGVPVGSTSEVRRFAIENTSSNLVVGWSYLSEIVDSDDPNFILSKGCAVPGPGLPPGESCALEVQFRPLTAGAHTETQSLPAEFESSSVTVAGTGVAGETPLLEVAPDEVDFGAVSTGSRATRTVTVTNSAAFPVRFRLVAAEPFHTGQCTVDEPLDPGASCAVTVTYEPVEVGADDGSLEVDVLSAGDDDSQAPGKASIALHGTAPAGVPSLSIDPDELDFGTLSGAITRIVTVRYASGAPVGVTPEVPEPWTLDSDCDVVEAGTRCTVEVSLDPDESGPGLLVDDLALEIDPPAGPPRQRTVAMTALVPPDGVRLVADPSTVDFGEVPVGHTGLIDVEVRNTGTRPVDLDYASVGGGFGGSFAQARLEPGRSTTVTVTFTPLVAGPQASLFRFRVDADDVGGESAGDPVTLAVPLTGAGVGDSIVEVTPAAIDFGQVAVGDVSAPREIVVTNPSTRRLSFAAPVLGPFQVVPHGGVDDCGLLEGGESCTVQVAFAPDHPGDASGEARLTESDTGVTIAAVDLAGTAVPPLTADPAAVDFGDVPVGQTRTATITFTNNRDETMPDLGLRLGSFSPDLDVVKDALQFEDSTCEEELPAFGSCEVRVSFAPTVNGTAGMAVGLTSGTSQEPDESVFVAFSGNGVGGIDPAPSLTADPAVVDFGQVVPGLASPPESVRVRNSGNVPIEIGSGLTGGGLTKVSDGCFGIELEPGGSCEMLVTVRADDLGPFSSRIVLAGGGVRVEIPVVAEAVAELAQLTPGRDVVEFGTVPVGESRTESIEFTNTGNLPVTVRTVTDPGFSVDPGDCTGAVLEPGSGCTARITFAPVTQGLVTDVLTADTSAGRVTVALSGMGGPALSDDDPDAGSAGSDPAAGDVSHDGVLPATGSRIAPWQPWTGLALVVVGAMVGLVSRGRSPRPGRSPGR